MTQMRDLTGKKFGRLTVVECIGPYKAKPSSEPKLMWKCICDCGESVGVVRGSLVSGLTLSCGCLNLESIKSRATKHGMAGSVLYKTWLGMKSRCYDKNEISYKDYGGRGIAVCGEWINDFMAFAEYIGDRPSDKHSIDRYPNNDGNYEPGNVRWATDSEQSLNRRKFKERLKCLRGHDFDEENTYWVEKNGKRHKSCKACRRMSELKRKPRLKKNV